MKRKNYLIEDLTDEEKKYINGIIWNCARECKRNNYKRNIIEGVSIFDEKLDDNYLSVDDNYCFFDEDLINETYESENILKPYSIADQKNIVKQLDNLARESELHI